jgi:hypothetical protein
MLGRAAPSARLSATAPARLGQPLEVEWRIEPALGTKLVTVSLVGSELVHRRVSARTGISIVTERSDFFVVELDRRVAGPGAPFVAGAGAAVVPAGLVPSHGAKLHEIVWSVVVEILTGEAETRREEFPVTVLPVAS